MEERTLAIVVVDDEPDRVEEFKNKIPVAWLEEKGPFTKVKVLPESFDMGQLVEGLKPLLDRQLAARTPAKSARNEGTVLWGVEQYTHSLILVDNDLVHLGKGENGSFFAKGDDIAYLLRAFAIVGPIVMMNAFDRDFDLRLHSEEDFRLPADLYIRDRSLKNRWLWRDEEPAQDGRFRPWQWPAMLRFAQQFHEMTTRVKQVRETEGGLGLNGSLNAVIPWLTRIKDRVGQDAWELVGGPDATLESLMKQYLAPKDAAGGVAAALQGKDAIVASCLHKWVNAVLVPPQDILIDAPRLAERYPSVLPERGVYGQLIARGSTPFGLEANANVERHRCQDELWLDRAAWFAAELRDEDSIEEVADPFSRKALDRVFCEDASMFVPAEDAQSFVSDLGSVHRKRWILKANADDKDVRYQPRSRLHQ